METKSSLANPFEAFVKRYYDDPVGFVVHVLGVQPDPWQVRFLRAIAKGERRISVRAGHGVGKSTGCAWAIIWHAVTRYPQKTVCTAPTAPQLYDALWAETKFWFAKLPPVLRDLFDLLSDRIQLKESPEGSFISARTSSRERPEALAGVHSAHVLLICDEAPGIDEGVYENASGSMSGDNACTILIGNPTRLTGLFYKTHHQLRHQWFTMHVSCIDSPRVNADFVDQIRATYGEGSNQWRVRVLGEFPDREDDVLIAGELIEAAMTRDIVVPPEAPLVYGLDVARFGNDRTVLCKRKGPVVTEVKPWSGLDLMQTVGHVLNEAEMDRPAEICVDSIGLGAGVADRLRELSKGLGFVVIDVNVSEASAVNVKAHRLRDDLWVQTRDWFQTRACKIPQMQELRDELAAVTYSFSSAGKLLVESKEELKRRGMRSPDLADALCLTFASFAGRVGGRGGTTWRPGEALRRGIRGIV